MPRRRRRQWSCTLLAVTCAAALALSACSTRQGPPNVLLLVVDTLRADHLGTYSDRASSLTPNLDTFARGALLFEESFSQGSNTINTAPAILASRYLSEHGYTNYTLAIAPEHETVAERFQAAGYDTFAISTNPHVSRRNGLAQGFDEFLDNPTWTDTSAAKVDALFLEWLDKRDTDAPFFALLWYLDPHVPYDPPSDLIDEFLDDEQQTLISERTRRPGFRDLSPAEREVSKGLYRAEVRGFDREFGQLREALRERGLFDDAIIAFTSDHGDSFWEHTGVDGKPVVGHGASTYRTETAVPLIIRLAGGHRAGRIEHRVGSIDVAPTLLGGAGVDFDPRLFAGRNLLDLVRTGVDDTTPSVTELLTDFNGVVNVHEERIRSDEGDLIVTYRYRRKSYDPPVLRLLDSEDRPLQVTGDVRQRLQDRLLRELAAWRRDLHPIPPRPAGKWGDERRLLDRLRALGYVR